MRHIFHAELSISLAQGAGIDLIIRAQTHAPFFYSPTLRAFKARVAAILVEEGARTTAQLSEGYAAAR